MDVCTTDAMQSNTMKNYVQDYYYYYYYVLSIGFCLLGGGRTAPQNGDENPPIFVTMARVSGSSCALAQVCDHAIYSTYLTCDVIHTCTFYEFLRI